MCARACACVHVCICYLFFQVCSCGFVLLFHCCFKFIVYCSSLNFVHGLNVSFCFESEDVILCVDLRLLLPSVLFFLLFRCLFGSCFISVEFLFYFHLYEMSRKMVKCGLRFPMKAPDFFPS